MVPKKNRSIALVIRRFLAAFIFLSIVAGVIEDIAKGEFSGETLDGLFLGLIIVFFLTFYSRKKKLNQEPEGKLEKPAVNTEYEDTENIDILDQENIQSDDENIEFENLETQIDEVDIKTEDVNPPSGYNPVKDNEGIFLRLFKGRNNRYG